MSIASKLKVIALEMGAELSQDDDSVEEILAKMQGHVGGGTLFVPMEYTEVTSEGGEE